MSEFEPEADDSTTGAEGALVDGPAGDDVDDLAADHELADHEPEPQPEHRPTPEPGDSVVAAVLTELDGLDELDLSAHPDVYQRIHGELQRALSSIDDA